MHVPGLADLRFEGEKQAFGVEFSALDAFEGEIPVRCKYQSKWYGNPVALTIYVNANGLRFSPINVGSRLRHTCTKCVVFIRPRG